MTESCPRSTNRQTAGLPNDSLIGLAPHDALLLGDIQNDFPTGVRLGTSDGDAIIPILLNYVGFFQTHSLPILLTRDWHPPDHCSFKPGKVHGLCIVSSGVSRVSATTVVSDSRYGP